jgi:hypothetical protein
MREILGHVSGIYCEVYMDDIIIAAETPELLCEHVQIVLKQLNKHNVLVKPSKCKWGMTEIEFLGHIITKETRRLTPGRGKKVLDLPPPKNPKEVRTFLGLVNAFQDYIPDFAIQQKIFSVMTSGSKPFEWGEKQQIGFQTIKKAVAEAADRYHVTYQHPLAIQVDASDEGVGGVLLQYIHPDRDPQPILYMSQAFSDTAKRWSTIEQEAYAIFFCIMKCEDILLGYPFTIMTDHHNLVYIYKATAPKIIRWRLRLQHSTSTSYIYRDGQME